MATWQPQPAPEPTVRRLPAYWRLLRTVAAGERTVISCPHIGRELGLDPTQVRKDLAVTGIVGKPRVGYRIDELLQAIETFLGYNNSRDAALVGVGNLGRALLGYDGFAPHGLNIVAAFDNCEHKIGQTVHGKDVLAFEQFSDIVDRLQIHIGIITTPGEVAQAVTNVMVLGGIRAIWNFSPARLEVSEDIIVENVDLSASLAVLSSKLCAARRHGKTEGAVHS